MPALFHVSKACQLVAICCLAALLAGCNTGYEVKSDDVYYHVRNAAVGHEIRQLGADVATFERLDTVDQYAKDQYRVYCYGMEIPGADPHTIRVVSENPPLAEDANWFYEGEIRSKGTDAAFKELGAGPLHMYAIDSKAVYHYSHGWQVVPGADPMTFEMLPAAQNIASSQYGRDKNDVYCGTIPLRVEHPDRFEILDLPRVKSGSPIKWMVIRKPEQATRQFGDRYADLEFVKHNVHFVGYGTGFDGESYYDFALRVDEKPAFIGAAVAQRLGLVEGKDFWVR